MEQFTVKDFIQYNNPCCICNKTVAVDLYSINLDKTVKSKIIYTINKEYIEIFLSIKYNFKLLIKIYFKNNKFLCNDLFSLKKYLEQYSLFLESHCKKCSTKIISKYLDFNFNGSFVKPIEIDRQSVFIVDNSCLYTLCTDFINKKSYLLINTLDANGKIKSSKVLMPPIKLNLLKNKDAVLEKIKKYLLFL